VHGAVDDGAVGEADPRQSTVAGDESSPVREGPSILDRRQQGTRAKDSRRGIDRRRIGIGDAGVTRRRTERRRFAVTTNLPPLGVSRLIEAGYKHALLARGHLACIDRERERSPRRARIERHEDAPKVGDGDSAPGVHRGQAVHARRGRKRPEVEERPRARVEGFESAVRRTSIDAIEADENVCDGKRERWQRRRRLEPAVGSPRAVAEREEEPATKAMRDRDRDHGAGRQPVGCGEQRAVAKGDDAHPGDDRSRAPAGFDSQDACVLQRLRNEPCAANRHVSGGAEPGFA
jgi:hypothetical protein